MIIKVQDLSKDYGKRFLSLIKNNQISAYATDIYCNLRTWHQCNHQQYINDINGIKNDIRCFNPKKYSMFTVKKIIDAIKELVELKLIKIISISNQKLTKSYDDMDLPF